MTIKERNVVLVSKDSAGNTTMDFPLTKAANIEDLEEAIKEKAPIPTNMKGATASAAGSAGLAPAPAAGANAKYLRGDGSWQTPTDTKYSAGNGLSLSGNTFSLASNVVNNAGVAAYKIPYGTCSTATRTAAKVATITNGVPYALVAGAICVIYFSQRVNNNMYTNSLNINSTGAKSFNLNKYSNVYDFYYETLLIYNGSAYTVLISRAYYGYSDYSGDSG